MRDTIRGLKIPKELDHVDLSYRDQILWLCCDPAYGVSEPEIMKKLDMPEWAKSKLRQLMLFYQKQGWVRIKLDDDDGYWWTTNKGIVAWRRVHGLQILSVRGIKASEEFLQ